MGLAISIPPAGLSYKDDVELVREAESLGYESCWVAEVGSADAFALGSAVAVGTSSIRIGTAVVPANTRGPAMLAMAAATLDGVSGGRGILGFGVSSPQIVSSWNGQPWDRPLTRARETIEVLRLMFSGERVDYSGRCIDVKGFRLAPKPKSVPIYLGALNPQMLRLAGRIADGVVVNMLGESFVPTVVNEVRKGAEEAGRDPASIEVVMRVQAAVGVDPSVARQAFRRAFGAYIVAPGYDRFFTWQGFGDVVDGVKKAFAARDREASAQAITDEMADTIFLAGDAGQVRARVKAFMDAGITTPAIHVFWPDAGVVRETIRALAPGAPAS